MAANPFAMVKSVILNWAAVELNTRKELAPLTVRFVVPVPVIVRSPVIEGRAAVNVMVVTPPKTPESNWISSAPPAPLAAVIMALSVPALLSPAVDVTVKMVGTVRSSRV